MSRSEIYTRRKANDFARDKIPRVRLNAAKKNVKSLKNHSLAKTYENSESEKNAYFQDRLNK